MIRSFGFGFK